MQDSDTIPARIAALQVFLCMIWGLGQIVTKIGNAGISPLYHSGLRSACADCVRRSTGHVMVFVQVQADEIAGYERYDPAKRPWSESFEEVVQSALTGMNGHLCGPKFDGEIGVLEAEDRVELRFAPCGSGGRIREDPRFGVTAERHDWAWNKEGVCYYCVHCCVLQQLSPIDNLGTPVRVIEPPTSPGEACTWTVYRSLDLVPDAAFEAVGRERPEPA